MISGVGDPLRSSTEDTPSYGAEGLEFVNEQNLWVQLNLVLCPFNYVPCPDTKASNAWYMVLLVRSSPQNGTNKARRGLKKPAAYTKRETRHHQSLRGEK